MEDYSVEIIRFHTLSKDQQLEEVIAILGSLPVPAQLKLVLHLTEVVPQLVDTKFFTKFAQMKSTVRI